MSKNKTEMLDWKSLHEGRVNPNPYPHLLIEDIMLPTAKMAMQTDFPTIYDGGSFPCHMLKYGPGFARLVEQMQSDAMRHLLEEKFSIDLTGRPTMVTVRGQCRPEDGAIHRDSKGKLVTVLVYLNELWVGREGWLRLLNSPDDINDYFADRPPSMGRLIAFVCTDNAWHGHTSISGVRRTIQVNWVRDNKYKFREQYRHTVSALLKHGRRLLTGDKPDHGTSY